MCVWINGQICCAWWLCRFWLSSNHSWAHISSFYRPLACLCVEYRSVIFGVSTSSKEPLHLEWQEFVDTFISSSILETCCNWNSWPKCGQDDMDSSYQLWRTAVSRRFDWNGTILTNILIYSAYFHGLWSVHVPFHIWKRSFQDKQSTLNRICRNKHLANVRKKKWSKINYFFQNGCIFRFRNNSQAWKWFKL